MTEEFHQLMNSDKGKQWEGVIQNEDMFYTNYMT